MVRITPTKQRNVKHFTSPATTVELFIQFHAVLLCQTELLIGLDKGLDLERLMLRDGLLICGHSWPLFILMGLAELWMRRATMCK